MNFRQMVDELERILDPSVNRFSDEFLLSYINLAIDAAVNELIKSVGHDAEVARKHAENILRNLLKSISTSTIDVYAVKNIFVASVQYPPDYKMFESAIINNQIKAEFSTFKFDEVIDSMSIGATKNNVIVFERQFLTFLTKNTVTGVQLFYVAQPQRGRIGGLDIACNLDESVHLSIVHSAADMIRVKQEPIRQK